MKRVALPPDRRSGRPVSLSELKPPPRAPAGLRRALLRARVRHALGDAVGRHLVQVVLGADEVRLEFDDASWARAAALHAGQLSARMSGITGSRRLDFRASQSVPAAAPPRRPAGRAEEPGSSAERLARAASKIRERRRESSE